MKQSGNLKSHRPYCFQCKTAKTNCYCSYIHTIQLNQKILILRDHSERKQAFQTAPMAERSLLGCEILDTDDSFFEKKLENFIEENNPFLLFKTNRSEKLTSELSLRNFIVLDGTWKKANKIYLRNNLAKRLEVRHLENVENSLLTPLRTNKKALSLSTFEAIYLALGLEKEGGMNILRPLNFWNESVNISKA